MSHQNSSVYETKKKRIYGVLAEEQSEKQANDRQHCTELQGS